MRDKGPNQFETPGAINTPFGAYDVENITPMGPYTPLKWSMQFRRPIKVPKTPGPGAYTERKPGQWWPTPGEESNLRLKSSEKWSFRKNDRFNC